MMEPGDPSPPLHDDETVRQSSTPSTPFDTPRTRPLPDAAREGEPPEVARARSESGHVFSHYVLVEQVGKGGMGAVWKAWDADLARWVAVKFLHIPDDITVRRFRREAQLAARMRHPNICGVYEVGEVKGMHFLVMEFVDGVSLSKADLPLPQLLRAMVKVCRAIGYAHRNQVVHRDIKPANIMFSRDGEPFVTDFGLAKQMSTQSSLSVSGAFIGTPAYMSPEQASGSVREIDEKSDIYSLGATLYALCTGKQPFEGESFTAVMFNICYSEPTPPRELRPELPEGVEAVILRALRKKKEERFPGAEEMAAALESAIEEPSPAAAEAAVAAPPSVAPRGPVRRTAAVLGVLLLCAAGAAAFFVFRPSRETTKPSSTAPDPKPDPNREWRERFDGLLAKMKPESIEPPAADLVRSGREILASMPASENERARQWFGDQARRLSALAWPKVEWISRKPEAGREANLAAVLLEVMEDRYPEESGTIGKAQAFLRAVLAFRGRFTLVLFTSPAGNLVDLRAGDAWVVQGGRQVAADIVVVDGNFTSPVVIRDLDIADYALRLAGAGGGPEMEASVPADGLRDGGKYMLSGPLDPRGSLKLRSLP
ncbi:MAG: serine/threonine protein kinase [Planctomycetes bacterium]|nr:serine/threonine protein kinase [Planctomycetota bacterium]